MSNFYGYYRSETAGVADVNDAITLANGDSILHDHGGYHIDGEVDINEEDGTIELWGINTTFDVWDTGASSRRTEDFLEELATVLNEPLRIISVGFESPHLPSAFQYTVAPNGTIMFDTLPDRT